MKTYGGIKNPKFLPIIRNRDENGFILTYTVKFPAGHSLEFNTLGAARIMAVIIE